MGEDVASIVGKYVLFKGFLAGSLFLISFFLGTELIFKALIFIYGIIALLDGLVPSKQEEYYPLSLFTGSLLGFVLSIVFYHYLGLPYVYFILVITSAMYIIRIVKKAGKPKTQ